MSTAYYWYRYHPYFSAFYPGKKLELISDNQILSKYLTNPELRLLGLKYFPNGLSPHGLQTLLPQHLTSPAAYESIAEIVFELVRQKDFPESPSRLSSLYASETITHAEQWLQHFKGTFFHQRSQLPLSLWEISFKSNARLYDAKLLDIEPDDCFSYLPLLEHAYRYWRGEMTPSPLPELLIPYPVLVVRKIVRDNHLP